MTTGFKIGAYNFSDYTDNWQNKTFPQGVPNTIAPMVLTNKRFASPPGATSNIATFLATTLPIPTGGTEVRCNGTFYLGITAPNWIYISKIGKAIENSYMKTIIHGLHWNTGEITYFKLWNDGNTYNCSVNAGATITNCSICMWNIVL